MASLPRRLLLQSRQCPSRIRCRASPKHNARSISSTPQRRLDEAVKPGSNNPATTTSPDEKDAGANDAPPKQTEEQIAAAQLARLVSDLKALDPAVASEAIRKGQRGIPFATGFNLEKDEDFMIEEDDKRKVAAGFWAEGEESMGVDEDYFGDDLTSHGHGELAKHRQLRHYNRLVAWEMPLLNQLAKPFTPPTHTTPFRFRYTSYLNEPHPAANKVVVEFDPTDLSLPPKSVSKLIKLAGPRYNPGTSVVKLSCEKFDTQAQNKRFLGESIEALLKEAKDMTDDFEDVPFDFRHHRPKKRTEFPKEWVLTAARKQYLENKRVEQARMDDQRLNNGQMIDGKLVIETSLPFISEQAEAPETVMVGGARGKELR
ncbi:hypothetical protein HBI56_101580 [Parastagonospora nodorum]|nr:hypothetical protein HBH53_179210 [Parastagonospora nodorum]KAH3959266.1 hypothetical protein HBH51_201560 [Parastagonospora nodorum]KAH4006202.1 hypothetical protein HBI10_022490 [Parastagonospora nodorum]KAH4011938.1 hypothetical protein HBI13_192850 [Parastagonospora nodorum]KAH4212710.1 hypothetical protein HBI95_040920 [Parastagonospora nodorum]